MEDTQNDSGAIDTENDSGATNQDDQTDPQNNENDQDDQQSKPIDPNDHRRAIDDMMKYKKQARSTGDRLKTLETENEKLKTQHLKSQNNYKGLYEETSQRLKEQTERNQALHTSIINHARRESVLPRLHEMGLRKDAHNLFQMSDLDVIDVETTSAGNVIPVESSVQEFCQTFKNQFSYAFDDKRKPVVNSSGGANVLNGKAHLTAQDVFKIERDCAKKGDMTPYHEAVKRFRQQDAR